jgi:hypothetical protein
VDFLDIQVRRIAEVVTQFVVAVVAAADIDVVVVNGADVACSYPDWGSD